jgi:hypothetical protein
MKAVLSHLMLFAWALWLGGTISVFVFGFHFFASLPKDVARDSARSMFQAFGPYEGILAGVAILSSIALLVLKPSICSLLLTGCLVFAGAIVFAHTLGVMHHMEVLHAQGNVGTPEWLKWHKNSMLLMALQAIVLLLTGVVGFWAIKKDGAGTPRLSLEEARH